MAPLLDAQALIAFVQDEGPAARIEAILREGESATTAVNLAEVVQKLLRDGAPEEDVRDVLEPLGVKIIAVDAALAWRAGVLRAQHFDRRRNRVSLADCCLVAAAASGDTLVSRDRGLAEMARAEGVEALAL